MGGQKDNPGPGNYKVNSLKYWPTKSFEAPIVECYFKGAENCSSCEKPLYGDYYKNFRRKSCLCFLCYQRICDPLRRTPCSMHKVRHCLAYHDHIGVEDIVYHKTTSKKIRRLTLLEKVMWNKFGENLDYYGKPM